MKKQKKGVKAEEYKKLNIMNETKKREKEKRLHLIYVIKRHKLFAMNLTTCIKSSLGL